MEWFQPFGCLMMVIIMVPNILYARKEHHEKTEYHNALIEGIEQLGRYGSMFLMIVLVPVLSYGPLFAQATTFHLVSVTLLAILYCGIWFLYARKVTLGYALWLAILPTAIFFISGLLNQQYLLVIIACLFGFGHITITYQTHRTLA